MTNGLKTTLARAAAMLAAMTLTVAGIAVFSSPASAGTVEYTMTCGDDWIGGTNSSSGATLRWHNNNSSCSVHYAWVNVYYANSNGSYTTGKLRSGSQASEGNGVQIEAARTGTYKSWHSGCSSGCYVKYSYK